MKVESQRAKTVDAPAAISEVSVVKASANQISCDLAGEAAILNLVTGTYFGLDEVGSRIWDLIQEPRAVRDIQTILMEEYDVDAARCGADLVALLAEMAAAGLVEIEDRRHA